MRNNAFNNATLSVADDKIVVTCSIPKHGEEGHPFAKQHRGDSQFILGLSLAGDRRAGLRIVRSPLLSIPTGPKGIASWANCRLGQRCESAEQLGRRRAQV